jgi:hypothetical protein
MNQQTIGCTFLQFVISLTSFLSTFHVSPEASYDNATFLSLRILVHKIILVRVAAARMPAFTQRKLAYALDVEWNGQELLVVCGSLRRS